MFEKPATTQVAIAELIARRRSPHAIDPDKAKATFTILADHACMAMIAVGRPGPVEVLPEPLRERELAPRERKPLDRSVFEGDWDQNLQQA